MLLFVSAALAVSTFLLPSGRISKTAKAVLSVFMTFCVIAPVFGVIGKNSIGKELEGIFSGFEAADVSDNAEMFLNDAKLKIADVLSEIIKKYTDEPFFISISADIGEDYVIDIESVRVTFSVRPEKTEALALALEKELGFMPEFEVRCVEENQRID